MKKQTTMIILTGIMSVMILTAMVNGPSSSGAPPAHTGAPGEKNCATSGCHDDNALNSGKAVLDIDLGGSNQYVPGKTYQLTISIHDEGIKRFGFQIAALAENSGKSAGKFIITDPQRTQLTANAVDFPDREYATYTFDGTDAVSDGNGNWVLQWKAPLKNTGPVHFYLSAVSANDDENDKGDVVYVFNKMISEGI